MIPILESQIRTRGIAFADGAKGYFRQEYQLVLAAAGAQGPEDLGVAMVVEGHRNKGDATRVFRVGAHAFGKVEDALETAGYMLLPEPPL